MSPPTNSLPFLSNPHHRHSLDIAGHNPADGCLFQHISSLAALTLNFWDLVVDVYLLDRIAQDADFLPNLGNLTIYSHPDHLRIALSLDAPHSTADKILVSPTTEDSPHDLFARSSSVSGNSLESRDEAVSCDDIISSCLATIFACTWVSVHPNVPPPGLGNLSLSWRRFGMMLVAVIAPELMAGFATRQFFTAQYDVSLTHGFFFVMGGFVSQNGHPIVTVKVENIEDKSKGDSLSKGVILLQGLWFTAQCLARVQQHLPLTELEVSTLAFQFVNIFIWLLRWRKPLDAQHPILLRPAKELTERRHELKRNPPQLAKMTTDGVKPESSVNSAVFDPVASTSVLPSFSAHTRDNEFPARMERKNSRWGTNWQNWWRRETWGNRLLALAAFFIEVVDGEYSDFNPESSISVPSFWSMKGPHNISIPNPFMWIQCVMGIVFGALHCVAWNETFPSVHEMLMWQSCSLVVAAVPFVMTSFAVLGMLVEEIEFQRWAMLTLQVTCVVVLTISTSPSAYIVARLVLIVLSFTTLRTLPPGALVDVNWSTHIPHF
ncbi:hypothetical protein MVEN_00432200 [Mycena venus]|uniref:Uncharacterized protein n=1 Tax=Mycena venus TaxID=2733690 RepID=A0A8H6YSP4_9AGAR|nr:hypothetical protein MVEN_00432200 [Mycena venus]